MKKNSKKIVIPGAILLVCVFISYLPSMITTIILNRNKIENIDPDIAEDSRLRMPDLITKYGYTAEVHNVTTEDGYILQMHRITGGPKSPPRKGKKVCLLVHGLTTSSVSFVVSGPNHALGYKLVDEGYDVWMSNARGNMYSNKHTTLKPFSRTEQGDYWSFSWHEVGVYDLPACIDYIIDHTGETKMQYIGHSQGTTVFFVMASERPEYNDKIEMMHALGPTAYLSKSKSPALVNAARYIESIQTIASFLGINYLYPSITATKMCQNENIAKQYCEDYVSWIMGLSDQMNTTLSPVIFEQIPAGASLNQFVHYAHLMNSGRFHTFDFGEKENLKRYKQASPADYNLGNINVPVALYYAESDAISVLHDIERLVAELPNVINSYLIPHKKFNHADFIWGLRAPELVYSEILKTMKSITPNLLESKTPQ